MILIAYWLARPLWHVKFASGQRLGLVLSAKLELNPYSLFIVGLHVARYLHTHESVYPPTVAMGMSLLILETAHA